MRKFKKAISITAGAIGMYIGLWFGLALMRISMTVARFVFAAMSTTSVVLFLIALGWAFMNEFTKEG